MSAGPVIGNCVQLCCAVGELLVTAKHNKEECHSLRMLADCVRVFLEELPESGISQKGCQVLGIVNEALLRAQMLLTRVAKAGPLVSLLTAGWIRHEFLRVNRDLHNAFSTFASGEKLLALNQSRQEQLNTIQKQLSKTDTFFIEQEVASNRLRDIAAAGRESRCPPQLLQRRLLEEVQQIEELAALSPDELVAELRDLQLVVLHGDSGGDLEKDCTAAKGKGMDDQLEEFLVQQLCAALAPKASKAAQPLILDDAAAAVPDGFLCPISRELMVKPVILCETGHSYEESNIRKWLECHSTCPATGRRLNSKQLAVNYNLRRGVHEWAEQHGVQLQAPPEHVPLIVVDHSEADVGRLSSRDQRAVDDALARGQNSTAGLSSPPEAAAAFGRAGGSGSSFWVAGGGGGVGKPTSGSGISGSGGVSNNSRRGFHCTRTSWAVTLIVLLVVTAAGVGVGVYLSKRSRASQQQQQQHAPAASPAVVNVTGLMPPSASPTPMQNAPQGPASLSGATTDMDLLKKVLASTADEAAWQGKNPAGAKTNLGGLVYTKKCKDPWDGYYRFACVKSNEEKPDLWWPTSGVGPANFGTYHGPKIRVSFKDGGNHCAEVGMLLRVQRKRGADGSDWEDITDRLGAFSGDGFYDQKDAIFVDNFIDQPGWEC